MYEFHPYFTNDGSVGLYSPVYNDIYHSATGALTEAYEKFVMPAGIDKLLNKDSIKVLDICYGIGYNSKSFLNYIFEKYSNNKNKKLKNFFDQNNNIETIHTNNISNNKIKNLNTNNIDTIYTDNILDKIKNKIQNIAWLCNRYTYSIHTNNILPKIYIKAVDNDNILSYLSPFIETGKINFTNNTFDFEHENIDKYLIKNKKLKTQKIHSEINYLILCNLIKSDPEILKNEDLISILNNPKFSEYFDKNLRGIFNFYRSNIYKLSPTWGKVSFLHNIYYRYISNCYKKHLNSLCLLDVDFKLKIDDARKMILSDTNMYDLIFLDAFTPSKCPCLWSYEFFKELYKHLNEDGKLLTYSTSASIRSAMKEAGFYIGYIYNERENKYTGTIATKNKKLIKYPLSEFDLGLLKTKAGIFYRDKNLTGLNEAIIESRKNEVKNSTRISTSHFKKLYKQEESCHMM